MPKVTFRLLLSALASTLAALTFTATPALAAGPALAAEAATSVTASSADLQATVNPEGFPLTSCTFQYGTSAAYSNSVPCEQSLEQIGKESLPVPVSAAISGLSANTTYHWRLVASNPAGTTTSLDHTFVYQTTGETLPDNRAYEMVSPPQKNGGLISDIFAGLLPGVSEAGSRVIAMTIQCFEPSESCTGFRGYNGEPFAFTRTPTEWKTTALAPPAAEFSENSPWLRGANDGTAVFSMPTGPAGEDEWYSRSPEGTFVPFGPATPPKTTGVEPFARVAEEAVTVDLSHFVWGTEAVWPFDKTTRGLSLYEYSGAHNAKPLLVGVSGGYENGENHNLISVCGTSLGASGSIGRNALSTDGRIVYFTSGCAGVYARVDGETSEAHTVEISPGAAGVFNGASVDGSRAFFTEGGALYESECFAQCETLGEQRRLIDLSAPETSSESSGVQGVVQISADGSHVYFVALGKLATNRSALGSEAVAGEDNLYVVDSRTGHVAFIATVPGSDARNWHEEYANVTPDGRFLVFESNGDLTSDAHAGGTQIFRYDAGTGQLVRISIGNGGFNDNGNAGTGAAAIVPPSERSDVGTTRGDPTMSHDGSRIFFMSPIALTPHALNDVVLSERFGIYAQNVYEYHEGHVYLISDGHDTSDASTSACKGDGKGSGVCLLGSDASGANVFFTTADRLVPKDTDTQVDIYDARICEPERGNPCITEPPPPLPSCGGEACHGIPAATPSGMAPGTATFNGEGNIPPPPPVAGKPKPPTTAQKLTKALTSCGKKYKHSKKRRANCERRARKAFGAKSKKSAHTNRRASR